jgi:hypothetical protein
MTARFLRADGTTDSCHPALCEWDMCMYLLLLRRWTVCAAGSNSACVRVCVWVFPAFMSVVLVHMYIC